MDSPYQLFPHGALGKYRLSGATVGGVHVRIANPPNYDEFQLIIISLRLFLNKQ